MLLDLALTLFRVRDRESFTVVRVRDRESFAVVLNIFFIVF